MEVTTINKIKITTGGNVGICSEVARATFFQLTRINSNDFQLS